MYTKLYVYTLSPFRALTTDLCLSLLSPHVPDMDRLQLLNPNEHTEAGVLRVGLTLFLYESF